MKELIIFDLDGTLIESAPDLANSINYMLKKLNKPTYSLETIRNWIGDGAGILVKRALSGKKEYKESSNFDEALEIFLNHYQQNLVVKTYLFEGVKDTLKKLKHKKIAIATNKPFKFVKPILKELDIDMFDMVIGGDSLEFKKPHPMMLEYICNTLNIHPKNAIMVGDSKNDLIAAKKANMESILVTYGYSQQEELKKYNPTYQVDKFYKILEIVND